MRKNEKSGSSQIITWLLLFKETRKFFPVTIKNQISQIMSCKFMGWMHLQERKSCNSAYLSAGEKPINVMFNLPYNQNQHVLNEWLKKPHLLF